METIKLGDREFAVRPLNLGQLRALGVGCARMRKPPGDPVEAETAWFDNVVEAISVALVADNPSLTPDGLLTAAGGVTMNDLITAYRRILEISGLAVGEAVAVASSSGNTSTDA